MKRTNTVDTVYIRANNHRIEITHPNKLLFPKDGITKQDLIKYYQTIVPYMVPFLKNRFLTLHRFVGGITHEGFYQKDAAAYFPHWIKQVLVAKQSGGTIHYVVANNAATLLYLTNQVTITYHIWLSRIDKPKLPDRMIFDLDPSGHATFADVRFIAKKIYEYCTERSIVPFCMTTGSRGVHVVVPLRRKYDFDRVRAIAKSIAEYMVQAYPQRVTLAPYKKDRGNKIYIDVLRNAYAQTGVAPYSVRARLHAPVATPISWDELFDDDIKKSDQFTIHTVLKRIANHDPWADFLTTYNAVQVMK